MDNVEKLTDREWILIAIFIAILVSFVSIAYLSDRKVDKEIEQYLDSSSSKQTF
ncbi:hypothetical protein [Simkania negevensis]|uniref:Uncharacterized protein n=1 Tax=Simkania negevensis (strain ATCC VR-1471 / DSM 27360 / Z) TaxID=331113 RepID=F8L3X6_SIMNZ|nr:hypothetical protein [Simkania negevensis]CCB90006.1 unknown protein [Simkania negevensis Z]